MKKSTFIYLSICILIFIHSLQSYAQKPFFIYRNDGHINTFFTTEIDSMTYSCIDIDSISHNDYVVHEVYTPDSIYRIPLEVIDSIGFVTPETIYKPGVVKLEGEIRNYIIASDSLTIYFKFDTPVSILPNINDKLFTEEVSTVFPYAFIGQVENIRKDESYIAVECSQVNFEDVFEYYYYVLKNDIEVPISRGATESSSDIKTWDKTWSPGTLEYPLTDIFTPMIYPDPDGDLAFQVKHNHNLTITPTYNIKYIRIVTPKHGTVVSLDISEEDIITRNLHMSGKIQWSHDLLATKEIPFINLGIPFLWLYGRMGVCVNADATIYAEEQHRQIYRYTFHCEVNSRNTFLPKTSIKNVELKNEHGGQMMLNGEISLGVFGELGVAFADRNIASVAYRGEAGISIGSNVMIYKKDINNTLHSTDVYKTLKGNDIYVKTYYNTGLPVKLLLFGWDNPHQNKEWDIARISLVPTFSNTTFERENDTKTLFASTKVSGTCFPVDLGFAIFEKESTNGTTSYSSYGYTGPSSDLYSSFFNQSPENDYEVYPTVKLFGIEMLAEPSKSLEKTCHIDFTIEYPKRTDSRSDYVYCGVALHPIIDNSTAKNEFIESYAVLYKDGKEIAVGSPYEYHERFLLYKKFNRDELTIDSQNYRACPKDGKWQVSMIFKKLDENGDTITIKDDIIKDVNLEYNTKPVAQIHYCHISPCDENHEGDDYSIHSCSVETYFYIRGTFWIKHFTPFEPIISNTVYGGVCYIWGDDFSRGASFGITYTNGDIPYSLAMQFIDCNDNVVGSSVPIYTNSYGCVVASHFDISSEILEKYGNVWNF